MNSGTHWLSFFSAVLHLAIGLPELLRLGPRFAPPAWQAIDAAVPDNTWWLYPSLWCLAGAVSLVGIGSTRALRLGFHLSAACFLVWALAGLYSWAVGAGSTMPGVAANFYITGAALVIAHNVQVGERAAALGGSFLLVNELREEVARRDRRIEHLERENRELSRSEGEQSWTH